MKFSVEKANFISHLTGGIFGLFCLIYVLLNIRSYRLPILIGLIIYIFTFCFLFLSSAFYHMCAFTSPKWHKKLRTLDHSAIYIFIAGSYTPILLFFFSGGRRIFTLSFIWGLAIIGILFKIMTRGKYDQFKTLSTLLYIIMGWISIFLIHKLYLQFGLAWLLVFILGGIAYTVGTYFYKDQQRIYSHFIWHIFVLIGAILQLIPIFVLLA